MENEWKPGWYATRLHKEHTNFPNHAVCGFRFPDRLPSAPWFENKVARGLAKCKHCLRISAAAEQFKEIHGV